MGFSLQPSHDMILKHSDPAKPDVPPPIGTIRVEFNDSDKPNSKDAKKFALSFDAANYQSGILICLNPPAPAAFKIIGAIAPKTLEFFLETDLVINITKHELVPQHILLSKEEKQQLLERYRLKENQLPRIQQGDPVAKYMGLKRGQVVKIIRRSTTAGRYASYRWCL
jgi:DNA-directed RNA polymerases I, II, and III subunit RPABC1